MNIVLKKNLTFVLKLFCSNTVKILSQAKYNLFFMKNTLLSFFISLFAYTCYCQDILVIKENNAIKVTIIEITDTIVYYKYFDKPDYSVFSINKNQLNSITFHDGRKIVFDDNSLNVSLDSLPILLTGNLPLYLYRSKNGYHFDNGNILRMPAFAKFLQNNGMNHVWELYYDGYHFLKIGQGVLGGGLALNAIGGILMPSTIKQSEEQKRAILNGGIVIMAVGIVVDAVSISIILKGKRKINQAIDMYNGYVKQQRNGYSQNISLHLNASSTNLGLILNF